MGIVYVASTLAKFTEDKRIHNVQGATVEDILRGLEQRYPDFRNQACGADGGLKPHVAIFVNDRDIRGTENLQTPLTERDEVSIISAIAGG
jgi:sulfur-carrier protein